MTPLQFTGADLRDWHAGHAEPEEHAAFSAAIEMGPGLSWEVLALVLRDTLDDPRRTCNRVPDAAITLMLAVLRGVSIGAQSAARQYAEVVQGLSL